MVKVVILRIINNITTKTNLTIVMVKIVKVLIIRITSNTTSTTNLTIKKMIKVVILRIINNITTKTNLTIVMLKMVKVLIIRITSNTTSTTNLTIKDGKSNSHVNGNCQDYPDFQQHHQNDQPKHLRLCFNQYTND